MNSQIANKVKKEFNFVGRRESQQALKLIQNNPDKALDLFHEHREAILWILDRYDYYRTKRIEGPRNIIFYQIISELYPEFTWQSSSYGTVIKHKVKGIQPSLFSYLLNTVPQETCKNLSSIPKKYLDEIEDVFAHLHLKHVSDDYSYFEKWINIGLDGHNVTIISPVCPDYAAEIVEDDSHICPENFLAKRHRFTFDGLGTGLGVTASYLLKALPYLRELFYEKLQLNIEFIIAYGNFEGYSRKNLARLNLDEKTFQERIHASIENFNRQHSGQARAIAFDDLIGGKRGWKENLLLAQTFVEDEYLKQSNARNYMKDTALKRKELYQKWIGNPKVSAQTCFEMLLSQVFEYVAMGMCIQKSTVKNPLILGADDHKMGRFYSASVEIPVLYLPRIYQ